MSKTTPTPTPRSKGLDLDLPHSEPRSLSRSPSPSLASSPSQASPVDLHPNARQTPEANQDTDAATVEADNEEADVCLVPPRPFFFATDSISNTSSSTIPDSPDPSPPSSPSPSLSPSISTSEHEPVTSNRINSNVDDNVKNQAESSGSLDKPTTATTTESQPEPIHPETEKVSEPQSPEPRTGSEQQSESQPSIAETNTDTNTDKDSNMSNSKVSYSPLDTSPPPLPIDSDTVADTGPAGPLPVEAPISTSNLPSKTPNPTKPLPARPPPSSFAYTYTAFPFQAYPGNPDPGLSIPGYTSRRRASLDSYNGFGGGSLSGERDRDRETVERDREDLRTGSLSDLRKPFAPFMAGGEGNSTGTASSTSLNGTIPRSNSSNSLYKQSAAANLVGSPMSFGVGQGQGQGAGGVGGGGHNPIPRNASTHSFRAPFLAPSSRPTSSLWAPPTYATNTNTTNSPNVNGNGNATTNNTVPLSPNGSTTALAAYTGIHAYAIAKSKPPLPSTLLRGPIPLSEKPWLSHPHSSKDTRASLSYYLTLLLIILGAVLACIQCFTGLTSVNAPIPSNRLCMVMDEDFPVDGGASTVLDQANWNLDLGLRGFGNGEFEMTTADAGNVYVKNGQLYMMPTLTSDKVQGVLDGGSFTLDGCTQGQFDDGVAGIDPGLGNKANGGEGGGGGNGTSCTVTSSDALGTVINPVQSARINTRGKKSIQFGKVEVRAKLPRGDWLFPQIFLLPAQPSPYGAWPVSGELDLLFARGNDPSTYPAQGSTFVRSSLSFGPLPAIASSSLFRTVFGFLGIKHPSGQTKGYTEGFHTYTMEWTDEFIRFSVDKPTHAVLEVSTRARRPQFGFGAKAVEERSYWNQAGFPIVAKGVGGGGGGDGAGNGNGNAGNTTSTDGSVGNGTDSTGNGNNTSSANPNATASTNSTFPRSLHPISFPVLPNTTHTNSSSSSVPSPSASASSNTNPSPNTNVNGPDTIMPITNPYTAIPSSTPSAPFDRPFYLVLSLGVGGTSGWFPDGVGGKMWFDGSATAMRDFARAQDTWYKTWPASDEDRALRIDYIKMWELC